VLMFGHHTGMRVTEISRITVADVMHASGKLREEVSLREGFLKMSPIDCSPIRLKMYQWGYDTSTNSPQSFR
jgi:hypothetical protein